MHYTRRVAVPNAGGIGVDRHVRGRHWHEADGYAPGGAEAPAGLVELQGRGAWSLAPERLDGLKRGLAGGGRPRGGGGRPSRLKEDAAYVAGPFAGAGPGRC